MPMIDACIPEGALQPDAEAQLMRNLADILIRLEGFDPKNEVARAVTWTFLHRPKVFVAGNPAAKPLYRFIVAVPEGQYDDSRRSGVVKEMTEAVAVAEQGTFEEVSQRVWVFPLEMPNGQWGGRGAIRYSPDIVARIAGEQERQAVVERLAERRRQATIGILTSLQELASHAQR